VSAIKWPPQVKSSLSPILIIIISASQTALLSRVPGFNISLFAVFQFSSKFLTTPNDGGFQASNQIEHAVGFIPGAASNLTTTGLCYLKIELQCAANLIIEIKEQNVAEF